MERAKLAELNMASRNEVICFLKRLWQEAPTPCPICGEVLEHLHRGAKKDNCDWQCRRCDRIYKTIHLMNELNEQMPD